MASFFVAGIIQGSRCDRSIHSQSYRDGMVGLLRRTFPNDEVYCPIENYPNSLDFDDATARETFLGLMERAGQADVVIAFCPEASMGTAIEMWRAHRAGRLVVAVSPMAENWVIRFVAETVLPDAEAFGAFVLSGELERLMASKGIIAGQ
ncbi:hypothetical protein HQ560_14380 [bacterium]|nr:hypothetical protein [bacterium]